jgi:dipeptidyl aminopeptidase/acylaminoacyl peptidase
MLTSALVALALSAPGPRPFTVDDLVALPRVGAPDLSRDGVLVAFTVGRISTAIALAALGGERMCGATASYGGRVLVFPDEGHWVSKPKNARVFYDVVLGWLDEHIGPAAKVTARAR